nr:hypothetical protein [Tanacetum cinerariifolium]
MTPLPTSNNNSQMHNDIMAAGSRDRPPMIATDLDKESYHKLFDILKQYQNEVNEIRVEKLATNANPLALVATVQHYPEYHNQASKPHKSIAYSSKQTTTSKSHASTKHKGKEIAKPIIPPFVRARKTVRNQAEKGVPLSAEQGDWLDDSNKEPDKQDLEAHYILMAKIQEEHTDQPENMNDIPLMEAVDSNTTQDLSDVG